MITATFMPKIAELGVQRTGPHWCKSHGPVVVSRASPELMASFEERARVNEFTGHMVVAFRNGYPVAGVIL